MKGHPLHNPVPPQATNPSGLPSLSSRHHYLVSCRASAYTCASLARGEKPPGSTQAREHGGLCLSQPKVPLLCITDAHIHALVGDGKHGSAERIQTFRCQACRTTFSARRHTPLYRLKTPSHQIAVVLSALAEGLDASAAERVFGYLQVTFTTWLYRAGEHAQTLHERFFRNLWLPHLQLDELRTRLRSATQVLWLWLAIDPCTKILPVLHLGLRTQTMAHTVIHSLRELLAPGCILLFTSDGLHTYFYALTAHFGRWHQVSRRGRKVYQWQVAENLIYGQVKKCYRDRRAGSGYARDAPLNTSRSQGRLAGGRLLGTAQYRFYRTGESDGPKCAWQRWLAEPGPLLSNPHTCSPTWSGGRHTITLFFRRHPYEWPSSSRESEGARGQASGETLPPADSSHGSRQNEPTMDNGGSPLFSSAAGPLLSLLRAPEARRGSRNGRDGPVKLRADSSGERLNETASLDGRMKRKTARYAFEGAGRIIHHVLWQHPQR
jgi:hypothetical protein